MKKILLIAATATVTLSSCQKNEILDNETTKVNDGRIQFSTIQNGLTRAASDHTFNSTDDLRTYGSFKVEGYGTESTIKDFKYIDATPTYNGSTWEYNNEPYWPQQPINFFAYAPLQADIPDGTVTTTKDGVTVSDFAVGANDTQIDFVVAKEIGKTKESRTMLKFKHTLTQIAFKAMTIDDATNQLNVSIEAVSINNIHNVADYAWGVADTHTMRQAVWTRDVSGVATTYSADPTMPFAVTGKGAAGSVTNATAIKQPNDNNTLLMIPQNFNAWNTDMTIADNNAGVQGAYVKLMAKIWVMKDTDGDGNFDDPIILHGTVINPNGDLTDLANYDAQSIYIPISSLGDATNDVTNAPIGQWVPGRRINYVITFGDRASGSGGGGWTDGGDEGDAVKPVLVPIRFTAVAEDWVDQNVPLLTANVSANTAAPISAEFIKGYTNNVIADINGSQFPKTFAAKISATSTNSVALTGDVAIDLTNLTPAVSKLFRPGSTITWDVTAQDWGGNTLNIATPTSWIASTVTTDVNKKTVVLTKNAVSSESWSSLFGNIDQHTLAIQTNIRGLVAPTAVNYTVISLATTLTNEEYIETGYLNNLANTSIGSLATYDFANVTPDGNVIKMDVPYDKSGVSVDLWTVSGTATYTVSSDGRTLTVTAPGTVVFTK